MIFQYQVHYVLVVGNRLQKQVITVAASSEEYAFQKVQGELRRRFGPSVTPDIWIPSYDREKDSVVSVAM